MNNGPNPGRFLALSAGRLLYTESGVGAKLGITASGGQPYLISNPSVKLFLRGPNAFGGAMFLETSVNAGIAPNDPPVTCSFGLDKLLSCRTANGLTEFLICNGYLYLGRPIFVEQQPTCTIVTISVRL